MIALRKKIGFLPKGEKTSCARKKIFVRTEINFLTYENIFSYVQKFIFLRTEILRLAHSGHSLGARRKKNEPSEAGRLAQRRTKRKGWLRSCEASPSSFEAGEGEGDCRPKRKGVATAP